MQERIANVIIKTKLVKINVPLEEGYLGKTGCAEKDLNATHKISSSNHLS